MNSRQLFIFIREFAKLTQKPVESLDSYVKIFWLDQVPHEPECSCVAWEGAAGEDEESRRENWLIVERPERPDPPLVNEELIPWVNIPQWQDSGTDTPELHTRILNPAWSEEDQNSEPQFLEIINYPQLLAIWNQYIITEWLPWAELDRRKAKVQACYDELFAMHRTQKAMGEQYEFLLAAGCLHWATPSGGRVKRHLLVLPVTVDFDSKNAVAIVRSAGSTPEVQFETDMLNIQDRPPVDIENDAEARRRLLGDAIFHPDAKTLLKSYVQGLHGHGVFVDTLTRVTGTLMPEPVVTFAPALVVRRRTSKNLIAVCDNIIKQLQEIGEDGVPACVRKLVGELFVDEAIFGNGPANQRNEGGTDQEIYFPLPYNEDQKRILETLGRQVGVLVQGPPGTGKSQTIANLICHLLATGKRILVTSQKAPALRVLKEKLPPEVVDLCVMVLGEGVDEQQELRRSVEGVASRRTNWSASRSQGLIDELQAELASARREEAKTFETLCADREKETFIHSSLFGRYCGTISEIAAHVRLDSENFSWFKDRLPDAISLIGQPPPSLPIKRTIVERFLHLLRQVNHELEARARTSLLPLSDVPGPDQFKALVFAEGKARASFQNQEHFLDHPLRAALASLSDSALSELFDELDDFNARLRGVENANSDWEWRMAGEVLRGKSISFEALRKVSGELLDYIEKETEISDLEVAGLGTKSLRVILQDVLDLKRHFEQGGSRGFWIFRPAVIKQCHYLMREVTIDGRRCDSQELLNKLWRWIQLQESIKKLDEQWSALTVIDFERLPLNQKIGQYKQWQSRIDSVLSLGGKADALDRRLGACERGALQPWYDIESVNKLWNLVSALIAQRELEHASKTIADVEAVVCNACLQARSAPENQQLENALHSRSVDEFIRSHGELARLWEYRSIYEERSQLQSDMAAALPQLEQDLAGSFTDDEWDGRISRIEDAWCWRCADTWLTQMADPHLVERLNQQLKQVRKKVSRTLAKLAAEKAWQHCMVSLDNNPRAYQNLIAWNTANANVRGGTGRHAEYHRQQARECLEGCRDAVPAWVMPLYKVLETVNIRPELFDVVIIDEASQSGVEALFLSYIAKQVIVVGDDQQIRPDYVGIDQNLVHQLQARCLSDIPNAFLFGPPQSLFSAAAVFFGVPICLREHFRCMPEIISFSNRLCYHQGQSLIPLRQFGSKRLSPVLQAHYITGGYQEGRGKVNPVEADAVVAAIERCCEDPAYDGKTFGVISLLHSSDQAREIENRLIKRLDAEEIEQRNIVCGDAYDFQGDERDVIFLSMVSARSDNMRIGTMADEKAKRRFNVAVSRARDQVQLFHSVQEGELGHSCLRRRLLAHMKQPPVDPTAQLPWIVEELRQIVRTTQRNRGNQPKPFGSWFEADVFLAIAAQGYFAIPQYEVRGYGYYIDIVIVGGNRKVAVECDGDEWHGPQQYAADCYRQMQLERCGWQFFRIRGSHYYRDPDSSLLPLWAMLETYDEVDISLPEVSNDLIEEENNNAAESFGSMQGTGQQSVETESIQERENNKDLLDVSTEELAQKLRSLRAGARRKTNVESTLPKSSLDEVLSFTNRGMGKVICDILEDCPNFSSKKDDLTKRVCRHFSINTHGSPREQLTKKIGWALTYLKRTGRVEEYKARNIRIRLLHPVVQSRLF